MKQLIVMLAIMTGLSIPATAARAAEPVFSKKYEEAVVKEDSNILIIFGTEWCGYCNKLKKDLSSLDLDDYTVCVVDADKRKDLRAKYNIKSYPTSVIVRNNKEVSRNSGYDKEDYKKWLDSNRKESKPETPSRKCGPGCKCSPDQGPVCKCNPDCKCGREKTMWEWLFGEEPK